MIEKEIERVTEKGGEVRKERNDDRERYKYEER